MYVCLAGSILQLAASHLITTPAILPRISPTAYPAVGVGQDELFGRLAGHQLFKRASIPCDGQQFWCPSGSCYTATSTGTNNGLIGCCDVASCAPRTTCIGYDPSLTTQPCDVNTGGCLYCSDSQIPYCLKMTNIANSQWIHYCATLQSTQTFSYSNTYTGSQADGHVTTSSASSSLSPFTATATSMTSGLNSDFALTTGTDGVTLTANNLVPTSTSTDASSKSLTYIQPGDDKDVAQTHHSTSSGVIAGIAVGVAAVGAFISAALWYTRKRWLRLFHQPRHGSDSKPAGEKAATSTDSPPNSGKGPVVETAGSSPSSSSDASPPSNLSTPNFGGYKHSVSAPFPVDGVSVKGLGIAGDNPKRYAPTNPDPLSATDEVMSPPDIRAPAIDLSSSESNEASLLDLPALTSVPSPDSNQITHATEAPATPMTPTNNHAVVPYTPSAYNVEPPTSVPRTVAAPPPSLPQDYSAVSLGSTANIYRGLSQHGGAPWAFLSPEDAMGGGWRNLEL